MATDQSLNGTQDLVNKALDEQQAQASTNAAMAGPVLRSTIIGNSDANPDVVARAIPLAQQTDMPVPTVERNIDAISKQQQISPEFVGQLLDNHPVTADFLAEPIMARLNHDNIPALQKTESATRNVPGLIGEALTAVTPGGVLNAGNYAADAAKALFGPDTFSGLSNGEIWNAVSNFDQTRLALLSNKQGEGLTTPAEDQEIDQLRNAVSTRAIVTDMADQGGTTRAILNTLGMTPMLSEIAKQAAVGGVAGGAAGAALGLVAPPAEAVTVPAGTFEGANIGRLHAEYQIFAGQAREQLMQVRDENGNPLDPNIVNGMSRLVGLANAGMMHVQLGTLAKTIPGVAGLMENGALASAIKSPQTSQQLLGIAKRYGLNIAGMGTAMGGQTAVSNLGESIAKEMSGPDFKQKSLAQVIGEIWDSTKEGAAMGAVGGIFGTALSTGDVIARAGRQPHPQAVADYVKTINEAVANNKMSQRSPEAMRAFLGKAMGDEDYYVNPQRAATFYQGIGPEDRARLDAQMPEFKASLDQALTENTDLKINRADYHSFIGPLGPAKDLEDALRLVPEHVSLADIEDARALEEALKPHPDDENYDAAVARDNFINQLIQQYGQKPAWSGNIDIAQRLGDLHEQAYNAFSNRYGHIPGAQDLIDRAYKDLIVQRDQPFLEQAAKITDLDLKIDRARVLMKNEMARQAAAAARPADLLGDRKKVTREAKTPTPVMDWLRGKKVKPGSSAAKDLAEVGVTPKTDRKMFSKYGSVEALDNLDLQGARGDLGDILHVEGAGDHYVSKDWLIQTVHDETLGKGTPSEAERLSAAEKEYYDQLTQAIDHAGADLLHDSNEQIKKALADLRGQMEADKKGGQEFKQGGTEPRGSLTLHDNGKAIISLFEKEDRSTVLHELGHLYWNVLDKIGKLDGATDEVKADIATIRAWVEAEGDAELTVDQHEKIADGFLQYLRSGKAPSADLQGAFQRFKGWLVRLYRGLRDTLPAINKDVAGVFDRMLATDEQIEQLRDNPEFSLDDAILNMLSKPDQARAKRQVQRMLETAKETLLVKAMRQMEREGNADYKAKREVIEREMTDQVNGSEPFRIIDAIKQAGGLNRKALIKLAGNREILNYMPGGKDKVVMDKGGADPRAIARLMNMDPKAMVDRITGIESRKEQIRRLTDEEMIRRHGNMLHDGTLEREAVLRAHNEYHANVLGMELSALAEKARMIPPSKEAIKAKAAKFIGEKAVKDIRPNLHQRAEAQAARAVGRALAKKDYIGAAQAKAQELLNHHMFKMATEARADIEKQQAKWRRLLGASDKDVARVRSLTDPVTKEKARVRMDIDYVYAARAILAKYGLGKSNYDFDTWFRNLQADNPDLADSLSQAMAMWDNPPPATQRQIRNGRYAGRTVTTPPWQYMTLNDFNGLADAINNLMQVAEQQNVITLNRGTEREEKIAVKDAINQVADQISAFGRSSIASGYEGELSRLDNIKWNLLSAKAMYRRIEQLTKSIDRGDAGPMRTFVWNPVKDALNRYRDQEHIWMAKVKDILVPHRDRLYGDTIHAHELSSKEAPGGYTFTDKGQLIGMLLHTGNESNRFKLLEGYGWDEDNFNAFIDRMHAEGTITAEDWKLVQDLWDVAEALKPEAQRAMKEMHGYRFDEITASPVHTPFGEFRGGYWPAVVDRNVSEDAQIRQDNEAISTGGQTFMYPSTGRGFTKSRVQQYAGPLEMSLNLLPSHIDKVLRFIHVEPAIKDVAKIVMNRDFRDTAQKVDRTLVTEMLVPWLQRSARQVTEMPINNRSLRWLNSAAGWLKRQSGAAMFIGNLPNTLLHMGQIFPLIRLAGAERVGSAMWQLASMRDETRQMIQDLSPEIRNRGLPGDVSQSAQVKRLMTNRGAYTKFNDWTMDHAYILQHMVWSEIDHIGWLASFNKAMEGDVNGIDAGDQLNAIRHADAVVRELQGSHNPEDISNIEARSHIAKLFQFWYSFFNNSGNVLMTEAANIARGPGPGSAKAAGIFYLALMNVAMVSTWAELSSGTARGATPAPQDYKDTPSWLLAMGEYLGGGLLRYSTGLVHPAIGSAVDFAIGQLTGSGGYSDHISASPLLDTVENSIKEFPSLYKAMAGRGSWETAFRQVIGGPLGVAFPILGATKRPVAYVLGVSEGRIKPKTSMDVGRGILAGPRPGNMPQR